jgi:GR25 family glycosyltransferase involved in LPS biosynthesis
MSYKTLIYERVTGLLLKLKRLICMNGLRWTDYIHDTVIINLKDREDRRELLDYRLSKVNTGDFKSLKDDSRYFEAIDKSKIYDFPEGIVDRQYEFDYHYLVDSHEKLQEHFGKGITLEVSDNEMAIALSHYSIWKQIVENKTPSTLILEDDVNFNPNLLKRISKVMTDELPEDYDILYLSYIFSNSPIINDYSENLKTVERGIWWLSGYILSYEGAKKLLNRLPIKDAVDVWINHQFKDMNVFIMKDWLVYQTFETISSNNWSFHNKFYRGTIYKDNI